MPLYVYLRESFHLPYKKYQLPKPMMVMIEGGKHAFNSTDLQEYLISLVGRKTIKDSVRCGAEIYLALKKVLKENGFDANVGNEGAFAPAGLKDNEAPWQLILQAIKNAGYEVGRDVMLSADPAVSEIFSNGKYRLTKDGLNLSSRQLIDYFKKWIEKYPFLSL
ncbi:MAG: hypothetical protein HZC05_00410 [Candidatus Magasanikbacteria bacterium]|nr:hypothetical protein [Candidatus Magasanikbacteria bacterium]